MRRDEYTLDTPVRVTLLEQGRVSQTFEARQESDLRVRVEMLTGVAWLELLPHYRAMQQHGGPDYRAAERVCLSYEKWGDWQQEVKQVQIQLHRLTPQDPPPQTPAD